MVVGGLVRLSIGLYVACRGRGRRGLHAGLCHLECPLGLWLLPWFVTADVIRLFLTCDVFAQVDA